MITNWHSPRGSTFTAWTSAASNQAGLITKLPAVGSISSLLSFSHKRIWLIKSDLLTIALQHLLRQILVDVGGLNFKGVCRVDVFLGLREWLLSGSIDSEQINLGTITHVKEQLVANRLNDNVPSLDAAGRTHERRWCS
jgi:hypothetical protein